MTDRPTHSHRHLIAVPRLKDRVARPVHGLSCSRLGASQGDDLKNNGLGMETGRKALTGWMPQAKAAHSESVPRLARSARAQLRGG